MSVLSLNHYTIRTTDLERSRRFYEEVVGLKSGDRPPFNFPGLWLYSADGVAALHLVGIVPGDGLADYLGAKAGGSAIGGGAIDHIAFMCSDLEGVRASLQRIGVPFRERTVPLIDMAQIFLEDPEGVTLELNFPN
jgi:catechol 2,3-dioxygenase-like lactoylglutathione lyase family enzyme